VPSTVLSALVEDRVYPDPYTGMNLRSLPGVQYQMCIRDRRIPANAKDRANTTFVR